MPKNNARFSKPEDILAKIIVSTFISLDGAADHDNWDMGDGFWNPEMDKFKNDELDATSAMLLGRKTYEHFAEVWPTTTGDFADRFNSLPKFVASKSLKSVAWPPCELLANPIAESVAKLKKTANGNILVHGSLVLAQSLAKLGLVDEYHLLTYPLVVGQGPRLFGGKQKINLELISSQGFANGVTALKFRTKSI